MITREKTPLGFRLIKTIRSHRGYGAYLYNLTECPVAYLATCQIEGIPSPYAYSPTVPIWVNEQTEQKVIIEETSHRCYQVFEVSPQMLRFDDEQKAGDWHIRFSRKSA